MSGKNSFFYHSCVGCGLTFWSHNIFNTYRAYSHRNLCIYSDVLNQCYLVGRANTFYLATIFLLLSYNLYKFFCWVNNLFVNLRKIYSKEIVDSLVSRSRVIRVCHEAHCNKYTAVICCIAKCTVHSQRTCILRA